MHFFVVKILQKIVKKYTFLHFYVVAIFFQKIIERHYILCYSNNIIGLKTVY